MGVQVEPEGGAPVVISGGEVVHSNTKYWHLIGAKCDGALLEARPGGRPRAVLVRWAGDNRVKLWLAPLGDAPEFPDVVPALVRGQRVQLERSGGTGREQTLMQARVERDVMDRIFAGPAAPEVFGAGDGPAEGVKDFCVETHFHRSEGGRLHGAVDDFPAWIRARSISISEEPRGQGSTVVLHTGHGTFSGDLGLLRINGHWLHGHPMSGYAGEGWKGDVVYSVPPPVEDEVRGYGDGMTTIAGLPDEPRPPRTRSAVHKLCVHLRDVLGVRNTGYAEWRDDVMQLQYRVFGMCTAYGQRTVFEGRRSDCLTRRQHWVGVLERYYKRRPESLAAFDLDSWAATSPRYRGWQMNVDRLSKAIESYDLTIGRFDVTYREQCADWQERLDRCEAREARYAAAIADLQPPD